MIIIATVGIWKIISRLDHVIDYITDESKTKNEDFEKTFHLNEEEYINEKYLYTSSINCGEETAYKDMMRTKKAWNKNDGILGYHAFQSFPEGEVTPDKAHEIGLKLAEEMWGDRFEVIVCTHQNTKHIHNHFVINSVSFKDGKKYYDNRTNQAKFRHLNDTICQEYGLSTLEEKPCKRSGINYANYYKGYIEKNNYHTTTKEDIDYAIGVAYSYKDFINILRTMNYEVINRYDKLSIRRYPYKRNIRIERAFGDEYSIERIIERIDEETRVRVPFPEAKEIYNSWIKNETNKKSKGIKALYHYYCYLLGIYPTKYPNKHLPAELRVDIIKLDEFIKQSNLLEKHNITTYEDLSLHEEYIQDNITELTSKRELLWQKHNRTINESKKKEIINKIEKLSKEIYKLKEDYKLCLEIEDRIPVIKEKIKQTEKEEKENEQFRVSRNIS